MWNSPVSVAQLGATNGKNSGHRVTSPVFSLDMQGIVHMQHFGLKNKS